MNNSFFPSYPVGTVIGRVFVAVVALIAPAVSQAQLLDVPVHDLSSPTYEALASSTSNVKLATKGVAGDLNGDGKTEVLYRQADGGIISGVVTGSTLSTTVLLGPQNTAPFNVQFYVTHTGDLNGDGKADLVWREVAFGSTPAWLMDGTTILGAAYLNEGTRFGAPSLIVGVADLNGDGKDDLVLSPDGFRINIKYLDGLNVTNNFALPGSEFERLGGDLLRKWSVAATADFNADGKVDVLGQSSDGAVAMWLMDGGSSPVRNILLAPNDVWTVTHVADFDGDGKADILWRSTDGTVALWLMDGATVKRAETLLGPNTAWRVREVADLNGDGMSDIIWQNINDQTTTAWLMNGSQLISASVLLGAGSGWCVVQARDFNGDGKADLVWSSTDRQLAIWLMNGLSLIDGIAVAGPGSRILPSKNVVTADNPCL